MHIFANPVTPYVNNIQIDNTEAALIIMDNFKGQTTPSVWKKTIFMCACYHQTLVRRSTEYLRVSVTTQLIVPPLRKNSEQTRETFRGKCPITVLSFITATAYLSLSFVGSHLQIRSSPNAASQTC